MGLDANVWMGESVGIRGRDGWSRIRDNDCKSMSKGGRVNACGAIMSIMAIFGQGGHVRLGFNGGRGCMVDWLAMEIIHINTCRSVQCPGRCKRCVSDIFGAEVESR